MAARKVRWAANRPDGTPIIIDGVVADVDDATGVVTLDDRAIEIIKEIVENAPERPAIAMIPMVDFANEVHRILQKKERQESSVTTPQPEKRNPTNVAVISADPFLDIIDKTLRLNYLQEYRYQLKLTGQQPAPPTIEELRGGPLGYDLALLSRIARDEVERSSDEVFALVDSVLELLFWPPGIDYYTVPSGFWDEPLGKLLSVAIFHSMEADDLITIGETASQLGVTRPSVYRWLDERILRAVRNPITDLVLVVRSDVDALVDKARQYAEDFSSETDTEADESRPNILILPQPPRAEKSRVVWDRKSFIG